MIFRSWSSLSWAVARFASAVARLIAACSAACGHPTRVDHAGFQSRSSLEGSLEGGVA